MVWYWTGSRLATGLLSVVVVLLIMAGYQRGTPAEYLRETSLSGLVTLLPLVAILWVLLEISASGVGRWLLGDWPATGPLTSRARAVATNRQLSRYRSLLSQAMDLEHRIYELEAQDRPDRIDELRASRASVEMSRSALHAVLAHYPTSSILTPTMLGNTIRAFEERLSSRYGMDVALVLPRLMAVLPPRMERRVGARASAIEFWTRISSTLILAAFATVLYAGLRPSAAIQPGVNGMSWGDPRFFLPGVVVLFSASYGTYRLAIHTSQLYGTHVEVAFDLYRVQLLEAMNMPVPKDLENQRELFVLLTQMFSGAALHGVEFVYKDKDSSAAKKERLQINTYAVGQAMAVGDKAKATARRATFTSKRVAGRRSGEDRKQ